MAETDREMDLLRTEMPDVLSAAPAVFAPVREAATVATTLQKIDVPVAALAELQELYDRNLLLSAHRAAEKVGDFRQWRGARALVLAGRLSSHLGAPKLASALMCLAWRSDREHPEATYFYALDRFRRRGPYAARQFLRKYGELRGKPSVDTLSSWYAMQGEVAAMLRDFDAAEGWLDKAAQTAPHSPWVQVCRSFALEQEDRYEEALAAARQSLDLRPWYRPGVQTTAHLLSLLSRDDEALALLSQASAQFENSGVTAQLHALQMELKQYAEAGRSLDRYVELAPRAEKPVLQWVAAQRSEIAYFLGDIEEAIARAKESETEFFLEIARRLEDPARAAASRVLLPVGFVRQHRLTCGPATLAAIGGFWKMPVDHLQVADAICYEGTSHLSERRWAEEHGWAVREFSVTEQAAAQLLDRGIPFTFTTIEPTNSHLQAVIGYDGRRGTITIRDPFERHSREGLTDKVLDRYKPFGPRGMALVPLAHRAPLDDLDLPDAALWDQLHELDAALNAHQRPIAERVFEQMRAATADHRVTLEARRHLAIYDGNPAEQLAAVDGLLAQFPDSQRLLMERMALLRNQVQREERLTMYRELCNRKDSHPVFWQQYAGELRTDARWHDDSVRLLKRAIRRWPMEASNYYLLAGLYWDQRRFDEATELYRLAASLDDKNESIAISYFQATVYLKTTEESLAFLCGRFERFGRKSSNPATTLAYCLLQLERTREAFDVLDRAMALRPDDGELLLYAADTYGGGSLENMPRALELLAKAKEKCAPGSWLRTAARLAHLEARSQDALAHWRELLALQPLAIDAQRGVAQLLAETEGPAAALAHLAEQAERFPHHQPLFELWAEWVRSEPDEVREPVIRRLLALNPDHAWGCRELAIVLSNRGELEEAWRLTETALRIEPNNPSSVHMRAYLLKLEDRLDEAREVLRDAIRLSVDADYAISNLLELSPTLTQRREVLKFVMEELKRQVIYGDGLLAYRAHARGVIDDEELLALLREAHAARSDLWHAWSALIVQLRDMQQANQAAPLAAQATEQFPLMPRLWLDRASVERALGNRQAELAALETAQRINPRWDAAIRALCDFHERQGDVNKSRELLKRAVTLHPLDGGLQIEWAQALWDAGEQQAAFDQICHTVRLDPGQQPAWDRLNYWADQLGCPDAALEKARELTQRRGGEARSWLMLARLLDAPEQVEQRLEACAKALELNPRCVDAHDLRARALEAAGRWDEALAACLPEVFGKHVPSELRARQGWIEADRGNLARAIELVREVLRDDPAFYGAWEKMCDWARDAKDHAAYLEAAQALVHLSPQYEVPYGYLGEARILTNDRPGAIEAFTRALELNPRYDFGGNWLFDLQLEDGKLDEAAKTLEVMRHSENPYVIARRAVLAARRFEKEAALTLLKQLCVTPSESPWTVAGPVEEMLKEGWRRASWHEEVEKVLEGALAQENAVAEVGAQWGAIMASHKRPLSPERFVPLLERGAIGERAIYAYLDRLQHERQADQVVRFARQAWPILRQHFWAWASIGMALVRTGQYDKALPWQALWREFADVQPWMLVNVVEALRAAGRDDEAREASRAALEKPETPSHPYHRLWLAGDAVLAGDAAAARDYLQKCGDAQVGDHYQFQKALIECALEMHDAARDRTTSAAFSTVRRKLAAARGAFTPYAAEPARKRLYCCMLALVARLRGTFWAKLWYWGKLLLE
jgi:tetratricopeptide (TPR) repeat protein